MAPLIPVPDDVRAVAVAALNTRAQRGGGGTAVGITIATALTTGYLRPHDLDELRDWHARNPDEVRDGSSTLLAGLYGGAPARAHWPPEQRLIDVDGRAGGVRQAAKDPLARKLRTLSRRTNDTNRALALKLHGAARQALADAIRQVQDRVASRVRTSASRSRVAEARVASALSQAAGRLTPAVLAALGLDEQDLLDERFAVFAATSAALIADAERRKLQAAAQALELDPADLEDQYGERIDTQAEAAAAFLVASLALLARRTLSGEPVTPTQGELSGPVPFGVIRNAVAIGTRGVTPPRVTETGPGAATAELLGTKLADAGRDLVEEILADNTDTTGPVVQITTWEVGDPDRPFEPHQDLAGTTWDTEDYPDELAADPGDFPYVDVYEPGDHEGCQCQLVYSWEPFEQPAGTDQGIAEGIEAGPGERRDLVTYEDAPNYRA